VGSLSILYYGFALPNTYYAKLNTGIPHGELIKQGLIYLLNSLNWDPLTLIGIAFALLATVKRRVMRDRVAALGILMYVAYVVWVGGDFMSGRFLTAPLFFAVILLGQSEFMENLSVKYLPFALIFLVGLLSPFPTQSSDGAYGLSGDAFAGNQGVGDERGVYYQATSLLTMARDVQMPNHPWAIEGRNRRTDGPRVFSRGAIGFIGFYAGPSAHIVDDNALADPLLARLPIVKQPWRIGHFRRVFPEGYIESLERGENHIADPNLARFYNQLTLITRGGLFAPGRWEAIWKMNTGQYERLIDKEFYGYYAARLPLQEMSAIKEGAIQWDEVFTLNAGGLLIELPGTQHAPYVETSLYHTDAVAFFYYKGGAIVAQQQIPPGGLWPEHLNR
jgi:arabinofuranosyltransferase